MVPSFSLKTSATFLFHLFPAARRSLNVCPRRCFQFFTCSEIFPACAQKSQSRLGGPVHEEPHSDQSHSWQIQNKEGSLLPRSPCLNGKQALENGHQCAQTYGQFKHELSEEAEGSLWLDNLLIWTCVFLGTDAKGLRFSKTGWIWKQLCFTIPVSFPIRNKRNCFCDDGWGLPLCKDFLNVKAVTLDVSQVISQWKLKVIEQTGPQVQVTGSLRCPARCLFFFFFDSVNKWAWPDYSSFNLSFPCSWHSRLLRCAHSC